MLDPDLLVQLEVVVVADLALRGETSSYLRDPKPVSDCADISNFFS